MKERRRKYRRLEGDEVVESKWFTISAKGFRLIIILALIVGFFTVMIFNVGYDSKQGWYWKPNTLELKLKKEGVVK
jgi:hypothetical protein